MEQKPILENVKEFIEEHDVLTEQTLKYKDYYIKPAGNLYETLMKIPWSVWDKVYNGRQLMKVELFRQGKSMTEVREEKVRVNIEDIIFVDEIFENLDSLEHYSKKLASYSKDYFDYLQAGCNKLQRDLDEIRASNSFVNDNGISEQEFDYRIENAILEELYEFSTYYDELYRKLNLKNYMLWYCRENSIYTQKEIDRTAKSLILEILYLIANSIDLENGLGREFVEMADHRLLIEKTADFVDYYKEVSSLMPVFDINHEGSACFTDCKKTFKFYGIRNEANRNKAVKLQFFNVMHRLLSLGSGISLKQRWNQDVIEFANSSFNEEGRILAKIIGLNDTVRLSELLGKFYCYQSYDRRILYISGFSEGVLEGRLLERFKTIFMIGGPSAILGDHADTIAECIFDMNLNDLKILIQAYKCFEECICERLDKQTIYKKETDSGYIAGIEELNLEVTGDTEKKAIDELKYAFMCEVGYDIIREQYINE